MKMKFEPTKEMINCAEAVFLSIAFTETVRPIVEGYQNRILDEIKPINRYDGKPITDIKLSWTMKDDDFLVWRKRSNEERIKAKLSIENDEFCPLLVAENLERMAKRALADSMKPVTNLDADRVICSGMKNYETLIDLSLRMLSGFVKKDHMLARVGMK